MVILMRTVAAPLPKHGQLRTFCKEMLSDLPRAFAGGGDELRPVDRGATAVGIMPAGALGKNSAENEFAWVADRVLRFGFAGTLLPDKSSSARKPMASGWRGQNNAAGRRHAIS